MNETSSESQDDSVPKRQKELVKLKYGRRRRRRFRKKVEKTQAASGSSDSEPTVARKSLELLNINCDRQSLCSGHASFLDESGFSHQEVEETTVHINDAGLSGFGRQLEMSFEKQIELDLAKEDQTLSLTKEKNTNWYSHLFGNIVDYVGMSIKSLKNVHVYCKIGFLCFPAGRIFSGKESGDKQDMLQQDYNQDFDDNVEVMAEVIIYDNISNVCVYFTPKYTQTFASIVLYKLDYPVRI